MTQSLAMASYLDALGPGTRQVINKPLLTESSGGELLVGDELKTFISTLANDAGLPKLKLKFKGNAIVCLSAPGYSVGLYHGVANGIKAFVLKDGAKEGRSIGYDVNADGTFAIRSDFPKVEPGPIELYAMGLSKDAIPLLIRRIERDTGLDGLVKRAKQFDDFTTQITNADKSIHIGVSFETIGGVIFSRIFILKNGELRGRLITYKAGANFSNKKANDAEGVKPTPLDVKALDVFGDDD